MTFSDRPTHPDFEVLAAIVRGVDDESSEAADFEDFLRTVGIEPKVLLYMADQRAIRAQIFIPNSQQHTRLTAQWMDAFIAGTRWARRDVSDKV